MAKVPEVILRRSPTSSLVGQFVYARDSDTPIAEFLGVPYATPPVNDLRFRPPEELQLWHGQRPAREHGPACPQDVERSERTYGRLPNSARRYEEDCLYLNVWTPACSPVTGRCDGTSSRPVLVWFHGGAFVQGYSNIYEGTPLAAHQDLVVISINYRVGAFGFLQTGDGPDDYHGNQGLLDQLEALRWVQRYIKQFGGDPSNVTVVGESAGGMSISFHLVVPAATDLFHRAIIQSGAGIVSNSAWSKQGSEKFWWKRIRAMGYNGPAGRELVVYLSTQSTQRILQIFNDWFVPTVIDCDRYLHEDVMNAFSHGRIHNKDCMIGFNSDEGIGFIPSNINTRSEAESALKTLIQKNFFRGQPDHVLAEICRLVCYEYLDGGSGNYQRDVSDMYGDVNFVAPSVLQAQYHTDVSRVYMYQFDHRPPYSMHPDWVRGDHGNEIPYMFGYPFMTSIPDIWSDEDRTLSRQLMAYWANFARYGNPNGVKSNDSLWPQYIPSQPLFQHITGSSTTARPTGELSPSRLHLWNNKVRALLVQSTPAKSKY